MRNIIYPEQQKVYDAIATLLSKNVESTSSGRVKNIVIAKALQSGDMKVVSRDSSSGMLSTRLTFGLALTGKGCKRISEMIRTLLPLAKNEHFWTLHIDELMPFMPLSMLPSFLASTNEEIRKKAKDRLETIKKAKEES